MIVRREDLAQFLLLGDPRISRFHPLQRRDTLSPAVMEANVAPTGQSVVDALEALSASSPSQGHHG
jgi:hypothetical protein